jgi:hypothetical protein
MSPEAPADEAVRFAARSSPPATGPGNSASAAPLSPKG